MDSKTPQLDSKHAALVEMYEREGYCIARHVLNASLVEEARNHVDWLREKNPKLRPEQLGTQLVPNDPFWLRLVSDDRLLDLAEAFIGPNIALFATHYIAKPPKSGLPVLWHQDGAYWPLEPMRVVTLWLAITESCPENGNMRVIPKTQNLDLKELKMREDVESVLMSEYPDEVDADKAVDISLKPGDVSIHNPNIVHGSEPNTSDLWRIGLTIRYIPTSTRVTGAGEDDKAGTGTEIHHPFLLRGEPDTSIEQQYSKMPKYVSGEHMTFRGCEAWE